MVDFEDDAFEQEPGQELGESLDDFVLKVTKYQFRKMDSQVERELVLKAQSGDKQALQKLWKQNAQLGAKWAYKYRDKGVPLCDLMQDIYIGWHIAVMSWSPAKNVRLSTWSTIHIKSAAYRAWQNKGRMIKVTPTEPKEKKRRKKFDALEGLVDIANKEGLSSINDKGKMKPFTMDCLSLDASEKSGDEQYALHERISCNRTTPDENVDSTADMHHLLEILNHAHDTEQITDKELEFLNVKWGIWDRIVKSTEEMSTMWRWPIEKVKAFEEAIFSRIFALIDQNKLSNDYFDRKNKKRFEE